MKASVIIPAWRAAGFVAAAIASARAQTLADIEIILVNDASPDETGAAARAAGAGDDRVRIIDLAANVGPSGARNAGFAAARGAWLAVLDADDTMAPDRLERLIAFAEGRGLDLAADDLRLVYPDRPAKRLLGIAGPVTLDLPGYVRSNLMFNPAWQTGYLKPIFKASFVRDRGLSYDPALRIGEDYAIVAAALAQGAAYAVMPEALYEYAVRDGSISRRLSAQDVAMLIAADDRFMNAFGGGLSASAHVALAARRASLDDALAFLCAVEGLKARAPFAALAALARRPAAVRHFSMPIRARLARFAGRRA